MSYDLDDKNVTFLMTNQALAAEQKYFLENPDSLIPSFMEEIREMGFEFKSSAQIIGFMPNYKSIILPIVIRYYQKSSVQNERLYFLKFFRFRGLVEVVQMLLDNFYVSKNPTEQWSIADCLYTIKASEYAEDYLKIISDNQYGISRQMIVLLVGELKIHTAIPILIPLLDDPDVTGQAISALGKFKKKEFTSLFTRFLCHKKAYYRNEAKKALQQLEEFGTDST